MLVKTALFQDTSLHHAMNLPIRRHGVWTFSSCWWLPKLHVLVISTEPCHCISITCGAVVMQAWM